MSKVLKNILIWFFFQDNHTQTREDTIPNMN